MRWRTVPRQDVVWERFDEELVVRNARTGSTHLLEPLSAQVFLALLDEALTIDELQARIATPEPGDNDAHEWQTAIVAVLNEFQRLGLAENVPQSP